MNNRLENFFCEKAIAGKPVRQPVNTFSNIIYLVIAIIIFKNRKRNTNAVSGSMNKFYEFFLGLVLIYIFICSAIFHATLTDIPLKLDYTAVCAFVAFPSIYFLLHFIFKNKNNSNYVAKFFFSLSFFITFILLFLTTHHEEHNLEMLFLILIFFILSFIAANKSPENRKKLFISMASVVVALIWFELDRYKTFCNPDSYLQLHSLWHLFIGLSAFYFICICQVKKRT